AVVRGLGRTPPPAVLGNAEFLRVGQDTVKAAAGHQWGLAPYHYVDAVYHRMRDAITAAVE
ncbi:hypothetical protein ACKLTP_16995, partial [Paenarthrobacter ureafaciens]